MVSTKLILFGKGYLKLSNDIIRDYEFEFGDNNNWTSIIWDVRGWSNEDIETTKNNIESFCLLKDLDVIDIGHDMREWVEGLDGTLHMVSTVATSITIPGFEVDTCPISNQNHDIVVSNVCWNNKNEDAMFQFLKDLELTNINIALSVYESKLVNIHFVRELKQKIDTYGLKVVSINALFYTEPNINIFLNHERFVLHFKKQLEFANVLGAKYVIYGSNVSRMINISKKDEYTYYMKAYDIFSNIFKQLAAIAETMSIQIILKPNKQSPISNFLFDDQQVSDMLSMISHSNVIGGPMRPFGAIIPYNDFTLIEFNSWSDTKSQIYIRHCKESLL